MTEATALPPAARHYLEQLRLESAALPQADRQQLLGQISEHLSEAVDDGAAMSDVLERLGSPRELVAEAGAETSGHAPAQRRPSTLRWLAVAAIAAGALALLASLAMIALTGRGRSLLIAIPGIALVVGGGIALAAPRSRREER